jgi:hypothetical protein
MRILRAGAVAAVFAVVLLIPAVASWAHHTTRPVVFVHGADVVGTAGVDCDSTWNEMKQTLNNWGWSGGGGMWDVGYYVGDTGCTHWINHHGSHAVHYPTDHDGNGHTGDTSIRHLGYHLAWFIRDHFGTNCVQAVGHSMGGLVLRYAIAQVENNHPQFPASICVGDAVTLGTPHAGTNWAVTCLLALQCNEMNGRIDCNAADPNGTSDFITWLRAHAFDPDGTGGTEWTVMGSNEDNLVNEICATNNIERYAAVRYIGASGVEHDDYLHDTSANWTADVSFKKGNDPFVTDLSAPWPVKWTDLALSGPNW